MSYRLISLALPLCFAAVAAACAAGNDTGTGGSGATSTGGNGGSSSTSSAGGSDEDGGFLDVAMPDGSGGGGMQLIYAHTDTALFELDPLSPTLALKSLGDFDCVGSGAGQAVAMTDIAVDKAQGIWGVSAHKIHALTIQGGTVHCGQEVTLNNPQSSFYGLAFAPEGAIVAGKEVLIAGDTAGKLWTIDGQGNPVQHGSFGIVPANDGNGHSYANAGKQWELSGDIVFVANGGSPVGFATVRDCPNPPSTNNCNSVNTLIEIDVTKLAPAGNQSVTKSVRGQIVTRSGCSDGLAGAYGNMYGIAAWNDKIYGFSRAGNLVDIDLSDGTGCLVKAYPGDKFSGAGVTTLAPILPPPPK